MQQSVTYTSRFASALLVDDHPLFCDALSMTLRAACGIEQVSTADRLGTALHTIEASGAPDVIVLDLQLPDVDGLDGLMRVKKAAPETPVIIVSSIVDHGIIQSAMRLGAHGYVPKHAGRDVFRDALATVTRGELYFPDLEADVPPDADEQGKRDEILSRLSTLTKQQARILDLICEGKLNKQIAYDVSIAETTVKAHVTAIMRKLGVQSRTQAVLVAREASFARVLHNAAPSLYSVKRTR